MASRAGKRPAHESLGVSSQLVKRQKSDASLDGRAVAVVNGSAQSGALIQSVHRTSGLNAQVAELSGHSGEVYACRFDPTGNLIASGSMDRDILLWRTYGNNENYGLLTGHKGAILDLHWSRDSRVLYSASADMMLASWDMETGTRIRRHTGHEGVINAMDVSKRGEELLVSGSDDGYIGVSFIVFGMSMCAKLIRTVDLGSTAKSSNRLHRDRVPSHSSGSFRSRQRAVLRWYR